MASTIKSTPRVRMRVADRAECIGESQLTLTWCPAAKKLPPIGTFRACDHHPSINQSTQTRLQELAHPARPVRKARVRRHPAIMDVTSQHHACIWTPRTLWEAPPSAPCPAMLEQAASTTTQMRMQEQTCSATRRTPAARISRATHASLSMWCLPAP